MVASELGYRNASRIASAALAIGREIMISMEGSDRADNIYATYGRHRAHDHVSGCIAMAIRCKQSARGGIFR